MINAYVGVGVLVEAKKRNATTGVKALRRTEDSNRRKFEYPMDINGYRRYWGDWDIVREFVSNAVDAAKGDWNKIIIESRPGELTIHNTIGSLDIKDFYLGYSSQGKSTEGSYIGRFNEGMKLGIAVALRKNYKVKLEFGQLIAIPKTVTTKDGIQAMQISIRTAESPTNGTKVTLEGIDDKKISEELEKKLIKPGDRRIIYTIEKDGIYRELCSFFSKDTIQYIGEAKAADRPTRDPLQFDAQILDEKGIFIGGMHVDPGAQFTWGYNFSPARVKISEGRTMFNIMQAESEIRNIMRVMDSGKYWEKIFKEISENKDPVERRIPLYMMSERTDRKVKDAIINAWTAVFGKDAVFKDELEREVEYRGGKVVKNYSLLLESFAMAGLIPTGKKFLEEHSGTGNVPYIERDTLKINERRAFDITEKIMKHYVPDYTLAVYDGFAGLTTRGCDVNGFTLNDKKQIALKRGILNSSRQIINTMLEELTHAIYKTDDTSRRHTDMLRELATDFSIDKSVSACVRELLDILPILDPGLPSNSRKTELLFEMLKELGNRRRY